MGTELHTDSVAGSRAVAPEWFPGPPSWCPAAVGPASWHVVAVGRTDAAGSVVTDAVAAPGYAATKVIYLHFYYNRPR